MKYFNDEIPFYRARILPQKGRVFLLRAGAFEERFLDAPSVDRFFNSLEFLEAKSEWETVVDKIDAFRVDLPKNYNFSKIKDGESSAEDGHPYYTFMYAGNDLETGKGYLVRYNDFPTGLILDTDSLLFDAVKELLEEFLRVKAMSMIDTTFLGYPAAGLEFEKQGVFAFSKVILRGNRLYMLLESGTENQAGIEFFDAFRFENFEPIAFKKHRLVDSSLVLLMPDFVKDNSPMYNYDEIKKEFYLESTDEHSGTAFMLDAYIYQPYFLC